MESVTKNSIILVTFFLTFVACTQGMIGEWSSNSDGEVNIPWLMNCLKKDSISCVQTGLFRTAKNVFNEPSVEAGGVAFVENAPSSGRSYSPSDLVEQKMSMAKSAIERFVLLKKYFVDEGSAFLQKRSLKVDLDTLTEALSEGAKSAESTARQLVINGNAGRPSRTYTRLLPFIIAIKVTLFMLLAFSFVGVGLLANKAMVMSSISLAISMFFFMQQMMGHGFGYHSFRKPSFSSNIHVPLNAQIPQIYNPGYMKNLPIENDDVSSEE